MSSNSLFPNCFFCVGIYLPSIAKHWFSIFAMLLNLSVSLKQTHIHTQCPWHPFIQLFNPTSFIFIIGCPNFMVVRCRKSPSNSTHTHTLHMNEYPIYKQTPRILIICSNLNDGLLALVNILHICEFVYSTIAYVPDMEINAFKTTRETVIFAANLFIRNFFCLCDCKYMFLAQRIRYLVWNVL